MSKQRILLWALVALVLSGLAGTSLGCPVCFGESDDPIIKGLEASIIFMLVMTYFMIVGGIAAFFLLRRRARRMAQATAQVSP